MSRLYLSATAYEQDENLNFAPDFVPDFAK
jgi:hypothetical protein